MGQHHQPIQSDESDTDTPPRSYTSRAVSHTCNCGCSGCQRCHWNMPFLPKSERGATWKPYNGVKCKPDCQYKRTSGGSDEGAITPAGIRSLSKHAKTRPRALFGCFK